MRTSPHPLLTFTIDTIFLYNFATQVATGLYITSKFYSKLQYHDPRGGEEKLQYIL